MSSGPDPEATFGGGGGGGKIRKSDDTSLGNPSARPNGKYLNFESLKWHFVHFQGTFLENIKVFNHIFNSVSQNF